MLLIFWLIIGRYDDMPHDEWQRKTIISAVLGFLLFIPMWFWAAWRERKFIRQEQDLKQQLAQLSGTSGQIDR
jgi:membrane protein implicated in regulation of membrane protease activity